jgi:hypothetical protein
MKEKHMFSAKRNADGSFEVSGHMRLKMLLEMHGKAGVVDTATGKTAYIHEVAGKMVALSADDQENLDDQTNALINRVRY